MLVGNGGRDIFLKIPSSEDSYNKWDLSDINNCPTELLYGTKQEIDNCSTFCCFLNV